MAEHKDFSVYVVLTTKSLRQLHAALNPFVLKLEKYQVTQNTKLVKLSELQFCQLISLPYIDFINISTELATQYIDLRVKCDACIATWGISDLTDGDKFVELLVKTFGNVISNVAKIASKFKDFILTLASKLFGQFDITGGIQSEGETEMDFISSIADETDGDKGFFHIITVALTMFGGSIKNTLCFLYDFVLPQSVSRPQFVIKRIQKRIHADVIPIDVNTKCVQHFMTIYGPKSVMIPFASKEKLSRQEYWALWGLVNGKLVTHLVCTPFTEDIGPSGYKIYHVNGHIWHGHEHYATQRVFANYRDYSVEITDGHSAFRAMKDHQRALCSFAHKHTHNIALFRNVINMRATSYDEAGPGRMYSVLKPVNIIASPGKTYFYTTETTDEDLFKSEALVNSGDLNYNYNVVNNTPMPLYNQLVGDLLGLPTSPPVKTEEVSFEKSTELDGSKCVILDIEKLEIPDLIPTSIITTPITKPFLPIVVPTFNQTTNSGKDISNLVQNYTLIDNEFVPNSTLISETALVIEGADKLYGSAKYNIDWNYSSDEDFEEQPFSFDFDATFEEDYAHWEATPMPVSVCDSNSLYHKMFLANKPDVKEVPFELPVPPPFGPYLHQQIADQEMEEYDFQKELMTILLKSKLAVPGSYFSKPVIEENIVEETQEGDFGATNNHFKIVLTNYDMKKFIEIERRLKSNYKNVKVYQNKEGLKIYGINNTKIADVKRLLKPYRLAKANVDEALFKEYKKIEKIRAKLSRKKEEMEQTMKVVNQDVYYSKYCPTHFNTMVRKTDNAQSKYAKSKFTKDINEDLTYGRASLALAESLQTKLDENDWYTEIIKSDTKIACEPNFIKQVISVRCVLPLKPVEFGIFKTKKGFGVPIRDQSNKVLSNVLFGAEEKHVSGYTQRMLSTHNLSMRNAMAGFNACVPETWFDFWKQVDPLHYEANKKIWWSKILKDAKLSHAIKNGAKINLKHFLGVVDPNNLINKLYITANKNEKYHATFVPSSIISDKILCMSLRDHHCSWFEMKQHDILFLSGLSTLLPSVKTISLLRKEYGVNYDLLRSVYPELANRSSDEVDEIVKTSNNFMALVGMPVKHEDLNRDIVNEIRQGCSRKCNKKTCKHYGCVLDFVASKYMKIGGMQYREGASTFKRDMLEESLRQGLCFFNHVTKKSSNDLILQTIKGFQNDKSWAPYALPSLDESLETTDDHVWSIYKMSEIIVKFWDDLKMVNVKNNKIDVNTTLTLNGTNNNNNNNTNNSSPSNSIVVPDQDPVFDKSIYNVAPVPVSEQIGGITIGVSATEKQTAHNIQKLRRMSNFPVPQFSWVREVEIIRVRYIKHKVFDVKSEDRGRMSQFFNRPIRKDFKVTVEISFCRGYYFNICPIYSPTNLFRTTDWSSQKIKFFDFYTRSLILKFMGMTSESGGREAIIRAIENSPNVHLNSSNFIDFAMSKRLAQNILMAQTNLVLPSIRLFQEAPNCI
jgi:hypothetical protein